MQNRKEKKRKKKRKEIILPNIPKYVVTQFCHFVKNAQPKSPPK